jgi:hypothetical protein
VHIDEPRYVADRWQINYNHYRSRSSTGHVCAAV